MGGGYAKSDRSGAAVLVLVPARRDDRMATRPTRDPHPDPGAGVAQISASHRPRPAGRGTESSSHALSREVRDADTYEDTDGHRDRGRHAGPRGTGASLDSRG